MIALLAAVLELVRDAVVGILDKRIMHGKDVIESQHETEFHTSNERITGTVEVNRHPY